MILNRTRLIIKELKHHLPFTLFGALTGIIVAVVMIYFGGTREVSNAIFYTLHPLHVVFSALVTTAMFKMHGRGKLWAAILIGYTGSIGIATLSDAIVPYLGGTLLNVQMEFHIPFIETASMPYFNLPKWVIVNSAAAIGIAIGYLRPTTKIPHGGHVLLSTWASLFGFTAFGITGWLPLLPLVFVFLFLAVWLPCCLSDIIYPMLFSSNNKRI